MLTRRGLAVVGGALALALAWVLLGEIELLVAAALGVVAVAVGVASTRLGRPQVGVARRIEPALVHEGDQAAVTLVIENRRRRPLADATIVDRVDGLGDAEFQVGSLPGRQQVEARYRIVCRPRGAYRVGPVLVRVTDPVGVAEVEDSMGSVDRLVVYPEAEQLSGFPLTRGHDPTQQASRPEFSQRGGEDFYTLRDYVIGDDLRYVHWPSSAKRDDLMIRQLETPWQSRALVLFDVRGRVYESAACFEKAVRGTASVVRHLSDAGFDADLWAGGTSAIAISRYAAAMEQLALVRPAGRVDIRTVAARMRQTGAGGVLILVTGIPDHELLEVHRLLGRDYGSTILMSAAEATASSEMAFQRAGALTMTVSPGGSWAEAWRKTTDRTWLGASAS